MESNIDQIKDNFDILFNYIKYMYMIYFIVNVCNISLYGQYCCIEMNVFWG